MALLHLACLSVFAWRGYRLESVTSFILSFPVVANVSRLRLLAKRVVNMISSQSIAISVL
jgi:hypothetical protein